MREPNPCFLDGENSASGRVLCLLQGRNGAELLHHPQSVPIAVGIHDFSASDMVDGDSAYGYSFVCRWNSHVTAFVRARKGPAGNHFVLLGNDVLDGPAQIRVGFEEVRNLALVRFRTDGGAENVGGLERMARGDEFVNDFQLSIVPDFFVEASNNGFVIGWHENYPPPPNDSIGHPRRWGLASLRHGLRVWEGRGSSEPTPKMFRLQRAEVKDCIGRLFCDSRSSRSGAPAFIPPKTRRMGSKLSLVIDPGAPPLLLAAIADHADLGHLEVAMFGRVLVHAVLFHFIFDFLFGAVEVGSSHSAGHGYGVTCVARKPDFLAAKLPGGAVFGGQLVLVGAVAPGQAARQGANVRALILGETDRRNQQRSG